MLFPCRYLFPRQLLVKHFWTPKQQIDFLDIYHSLRKQSHSEIITHLERASALVSDERLRWHLKDLCTKVLPQPSHSPAGPGRSLCTRIGQSLKSTHFLLLPRCRTAPTQQHMTSWLSGSASLLGLWAWINCRLCTWWALGGLLCPQAHCVLGCKVRQFHILPTCCVTESLEPGHAPHPLPASRLVEMAFEKPHHCDTPAGQGSGKAGGWPADCSGSEIGKRLTAVSSSVPEWAGSLQGSSSCLYQISSCFCIVLLILI